MTTTSTEIIEENTTIGADTASKIEDGTDAAADEKEVSGYNDFDYTVTNSDGSYHGGL